MRIDCSVSILDREDGGSNPPQEIERNGSVSVKTERNGRVGRASFHSSTSADDGDFCRRLGSIQIIVLVYVLG
jgi:hypothetical protein